MFIRNANFNDLRKIHEFICEVEEMDFDFEEFRFDFTKNLEKENIIYLIAQNNQGVVLGFLSCYGRLFPSDFDLIYQVQELYIYKNDNEFEIENCFMDFLDNILIKLNSSVFGVATLLKNTTVQTFYTKSILDKKLLKFSQILN
jgi:hypothetical protein